MLSGPSDARVDILDVDFSRLLIRTPAHQAATAATPIAKNNLNFRMVAGNAD